MTALTIVRATMMLATLAWAVGEVLMRRSAVADRLARAAWTTGVALAVLHVILAFQFVYAWDHEGAVDATAQQTARLIGRGWRGAIYINYIFLMIWFADLSWWWLSAHSHAMRSVQLETARRALFTFMFFNGAVVFASSTTTRVVGLAAVTAALIASRARLPQVWFAQ